MCGGNVGAIASRACPWAWLTSTYTLGRQRGIFTPQHGEEGHGNTILAIAALRPCAFETRYTI